jgi:bile acid-coenzyme A ligase
MSETPVYPSIGTNLADAAVRLPDAPAVTCDGRTITYRELHENSNRMARALLKLGAKHGDFVTIALPNSIGFIETNYAVWKIGATPQPVSSRLPQNELQAIVDLAKTPLIVSNSKMALGKPVVSAEELLAMSDDTSELPDAVAPYLKAPTSGGSTGRPKLIVSGADGTATIGPGELGLYRMKEGDVLLMPGPLYHNGPFGLATVAQQARAHLVIMPKFDAEEMLRLIEKYCAVWTYMVPTMMSRVWRVANRESYDVSSLKTVWHMAAPCPPWLKEEWIGWLGPDAIWELYGGTEAQAMTVITGAEWLKKKGSVGKVFGSNEMKAFSPDGKVLGANETGEVFMRRDPSLPPAYHYIGAEARVLPDGWESLGDIGYFDEDGYLFLADRRTDMVLIGGANVYPAEIEAALDEHPLVASSAVIGLPDEDMGSRLHAIIHPRDGLDLEELQKHLAERLLVYKRPRTFELVGENLRDDAGKVRRSALRDERIAKTKVMP